MAISDEPRAGFSVRFLLTTNSTEQVFRMLQNCCVKSYTDVKSKVQNVFYFTQFVMLVLLSYCVYPAQCYFFKCLILLGLSFILILTYCIIFT